MGCPRVDDCNPALKPDSVAAELAVSLGPPWVAADREQGGIGFDFGKGWVGNGCLVGMGLACRDRA